MTQSGGAAGGSSLGESGSFQRRFLLLAVVLVSLVFLVMVRHFIVAVLLAAIFSGMSHPLYRRVLRWVGGREVLAASLVVLMLFFVILGPLTGFLGLVAAQAVEVTQVSNREFGGVISGITLKYRDRVKYLNEY